MFTLLGIAVSNLIYLILHVTNNGSFPKPLTAAEERECLERMQQGDKDARDRLIEHNLRLVAHIIKNRPSERIFFYAKPADKPGSGITAGKPLRELGRCPNPCSL